MTEIDEARSAVTKPPSLSGRVLAVEDLLVQLAQDVLECKLNEPGARARLLSRMAVVARRAIVIETAKL